METRHENLEVNLLGIEESESRLKALCALMRENGICRGIVSSNANIYYLTGRIFRGYVYVDAEAAKATCFVRRPSHLTGETCVHIGKPADMKEHIAGLGETALAFELDSLPWSATERLASVLGIEVSAARNLSGVLRQARAVKTDREKELLRQSGLKQSYVYSRIPYLYTDGMTDLELQIEIERLSRLEGCLGIFRVGGTEMEIFMGNVLTGENADTPSPYDFAMGGAGANPSLPVGADGSLIRPNFPVMVDMNGNYTGYMTDMTRCFILGEAPAMALKANKLSADICRALADMMIPGTPASALYEKAAAMASEAGMEDYFMGHRSKAPFVGHGVGIEINELPVIAPKSRDILANGNVIALEPKFVIDGLGAVGIENTYIVTDRGGELITTAPEDIKALLP